MHVHTGPADPNKAMLGCLVALTAAHEGHDVTLFLAGDGVHLLGEHPAEFAMPETLIDLAHAAETVLCY